MKVDVLDITGKKIDDVTLNKEIFIEEPNLHVLKQALDLTRASMRQGTHSTKTRAEVRGGGRKPWRQKGTGRARHGSIRSNIWTGGGVAFGPKPNKNYTKKMNRKVRTLALLSALSVKENDLVIVEELKMTTPKTKDFLKVLKDLKLEDEKLLIVVRELDENIVLASRNLEKVFVIDINELNVLDLIDSTKVLFTKDAYEALEEVLI